MNEIQELKRQGLSISQISVLSGYDRKTIRKYLEHPQRPRYGPRPKRGVNTGVIIGHVTGAKVGHWLCS